MTPKMEEHLQPISAKKRKVENYSKIIMVGRQSQSSKSRVSSHTYQNLETGPLYLTILVLYINNTSEKDISKSSQIKEQHEAIKLLNEEIRMLQQKHLKFCYSTDRPVIEKS